MDFNNTLQNTIDSKTKPTGSLGMLEKIAFKIGQIQQTINPILSKPTILVFAGDHGIVKKEPVSLYPQEVTAQMVLNFLNGGAAINVFCKQHHINLKIIDAGVNYKFNQHLGLIDAKINIGTASFSETVAMSVEDCIMAIEKGKELVSKQFSEGTNIIGFGEMGIGNTSSAAMLMSAFTDIDIENCVGKGTGLNKNGVDIKTTILKKAQNLHGKLTTPLNILAAFGGYEIAMMVGAFLQAKKLNMTIIVDGFIVTSALLAANAIEKSVIDNCIFSHCSNEQGHQKILTFLKTEAILNLGLRLGEGTGVAIAYPLIESSVNFLNEMTSFESANVSKN